MANVKNSQSGFRLAALPIFLVAIFLMMFAGDSYSALFVNASTTIAFSLIVFQILAIYKEGGKNWIQVDLLFLIMFFLTHFWIWISLQTNSDKVLIWYEKSPSQVNYTAALTLAAMAAFAIGFNLSAKKTSNITVVNTGSRNWLKIGYLIFYIGTALVLSYVLYFGIAAFQGSYAGSAGGELGSRNVYFLQSIFLNLGIVIILIANSDLSRRIPKPIISVAIFGLVLLMYLILGDRSEFLFFASIFAFAYSRSYKSIPFKYLIGGIVLVSILMSAVQVARRADERSLSAISDALFTENEEVSAAAGLDNVGASGIVTLVAIQTVPEKYDYFYGQLKKVELMGLVPFGRKFLPTEEDLQLAYLDSSRFLTSVILGPHSATGTGTTLVADLYVDFGVPGVIFGLALVGYLARFVQEKANGKGSFIWPVVFCYFAGLLVILPRYSFMKIIRGLLWPLVFLWILDWYGRKGNRNTQISKDAGRTTKL